MKEMTFTTLAELKEFLNALDEDELGAALAMHDAYTIQVSWSLNTHWYSIESFEGGEE